MKSAASTTRLSTPMSKRTVFTTITPLPPHIGRAAIVAFLHDYEAMIDINPLVTDRYQISPPRDAEPDEANCVWYQLTDAVVMPWSQAAADGANANAKSGNVSYTCVFHPLSDGLQTHCRAPLGVDIRDRWTVGGTAPGEPRQPVELGLEALGAPATGLYLREDVDLRCNRLMAGFVKKTLKKSHEAVVKKLNDDLSASATEISPVDQQTQSADRETITPTPAKQRPVSFSVTSPSLVQRPLPYRVYPQQQPQPQPQPQQQQYQAFQPSPQQLQSMQQQYRPQRQSLPAQQHYAQPYVPSQSHYHHPYRHHRQAQSYSPYIPAPAAPQNTSVSAALTVSAASAVAAVPVALTVGPPPGPAQRQALQAQQQNQQHQRSLHPHFPQPSRSHEHASVDLSSLASSPCLSFSSAVSTASTASTAATTASSPALSSSSSLPSPQPAQYDRFKMSASPLTRLQLQLPTVVAVPGRSTAFGGDGPVRTDKGEHRRSLGPPHLPPLVTGPREGVGAPGNEPRRKSTGSDEARRGAAADLHDPGLCPLPLRVGGQQPRPVSLASSLEQLPSQQPAAPGAPVQPPMAVSPVAAAQPDDSLAQLFGQLEGPAAAAAGAGAPDASAYVYNEDDYEDIYVETPADSPILVAHRQPKPHAPHGHAYSPTVFAEQETATGRTKTSEPVPEWQQWRQFLREDMD